MCLQRHCRDVTVTIKQSFFISLEISNTAICWIKYS